MISREVQQPRLLSSEVTGRADVKHKYCTLRGTDYYLWGRRVRLRHDRCQLPLFGDSTPPSAQGMNGANPCNRRELWETQ